MSKRQWSTQRACFTFCSLGTQPLHVLGKHAFDQSVDACPTPTSNLKFRAPIDCSIPETSCRVFTRASHKIQPHLCLGDRDAAWLQLARPKHVHCPSGACSASNARLRVRAPSESRTAEHMHGRASHCSRPSRFEIQHSDRTASLLRSFGEFIDVGEERQCGVA